MIGTEKIMPGAMADKNTKSSGCLLPISRVKTIMKSSPEASTISQESLFLITKATELFVAHLAKNALEESKDKEHLEYNVLADIVDTDETFTFLQDIIPKKIKFREYQAQMQRRRSLTGDKA